MQLTKFSIFGGNLPGDNPSRWKFYVKKITYWGQADSQLDFVSTSFLDESKQANLYDVWGVLSIHEASLPYVSL